MYRMALRSKHANIQFKFVILLLQGYELSFSLRYNIVGSFFLGLMQCAF
uniref:Uncharacterized protein n=1 Tax=Arundo donax TaxID=35708 RepID=A0A0A8Y2Q9_ARUDO